MGKLDVPQHFQAHRVWGFEGIGGRGMALVGHGGDEEDRWGEEGTQHIPRPLSQREDYA